VSRRSIAAAAVVACFTMPALTSGREATTPRERLREAATGTWSGAHGTLEFHADGTATFAIVSPCYIPIRPGFVEAPTDCGDDTVNGALEIHTGGYDIVQNDGTAYHFGAYVAGDELHVGGDPVARLDEDRNGTVSLGAGVRLRIEDGRCRYTEPGLADPIEEPCRFVRRQHRTVLLYTAPDPFEGGKVGERGLVYLAGQRLVVGPELVERPFARVAP